MVNLRWLVLSGRWNWVLFPLSELRQVLVKVTQAVDHGYLTEETGEGLFHLSPRYIKEKKFLATHVSY